MTPRWDGRRRPSLRVHLVARREGMGPAEGLETSAAGPTLAALRDRLEAIRRAELERAMRRLQNLAPAQQEVVSTLTSAIVDRIFELPAAAVRAWAPAGDGPLCTATLRDMFHLRDVPGGDAGAGG